MTKFDVTPLLPFYDKITDVCLAAYHSEEEISPRELMEQLMDIPGMPMHCPPHHYMMPALLLTCAARLNGTPEDLYQEQMAEARDRALDVLGGFCGWYGACGAAVGLGIFTSIYTNSNPHTKEHWGDCNLATGKALVEIGSIAGPRCCKRNSYIALKSGLETLKETLGLDFPGTGEIVCKYHDKNNECKGAACPFFPKD